MADDVTPSDVRARRFDSTRRGYDRAEVDSYLSSLAEQIERLTGKLEQRKTAELKVGLDDPEALALELQNIGGEVASILETARAAAEGMRSRAASDVESWRTTTERETQALSTDAIEQSQSMRAAAWNEGSSMLASSIAAAKTLVEEAREDALFIRAEAEREAIRLTGDAKRDRDELIRSARLQAEEMIESARGESNGMLAAASQQAEQAQERARALEDRRAELLSELESTRASISHLEEEIDSRRQELEIPEPEIEPMVDPQLRHGQDSGSVRIVPSSKSVTLRPVDADDLVADVVALRAGSHVELVADESPTTEPLPADPVETETVTVIAPPPVHEVKAEEPEPAPEPQPEMASDAEPASDDIGSLFASLREDTAEQPVVVPEVPQEPVTAIETDADIPEPAAEPTVEAEPPAVAAVTEPPEPEPTSDTTLIPLQNAALKEIKRTLVDLQNDALDHLRTEDGWTPKKAFTNKFKAPFAELATDIGGTKADGAAAAKEFSADLFAAVSGAIEKARESGAGERQVASSVSRVFRMWRADEAERRVLDAAQSLSSSS